MSWSEDHIIQKWEKQGKTVGHNFLTIPLQVKMQKANKVPEH